MRAPPSARRVALEALLAITEQGAYAHLCLKQAQAGLSAQDAHFVSALVYETLEHLCYIDYMLLHYAKGRQKPVIRGILRLGACQILHMQVPASAACNESVKLTKQVGKGALAGYVNGVLRTLAREKDTLVPLPEEPAARLSVLYGWPHFIVEEWLQTYGAAQTEALLKRPPRPMSLRAQPPGSTAALRAHMQALGIPYTVGRWDENCIQIEKGFSVAEDPLYQAGQCTVQSESAMLTCRACGVQPGMRVLDACAAPGGKSAYLYALAKGELDLHAWELHPHRKALLDATLARLHVEAGTRIADAAVYEEAWREAFDLVLLDVPCSGFGVSKPDVRHGKSQADIASLAQVQKRILDACARYVRPGGVLVYASCTISRAENEAQIEGFLHAHPAFCLESLQPYLPEALLGETTGCVQLLPHRHGMEGFFIARMREVRRA